MKKLIIAIIIIQFTLPFFGQEKPVNNLYGMFKLDAHSLIYGIINEKPTVTIDWVPYIFENFGLPIEFDITYDDPFIISSLRGGIEFVIPVDFDKNGPYFSLLAGAYLTTDIFWPNIKAKIGYQFLVDNIFVFTPSISYNYNGNSNDTFVAIVLDVGIAY